MKMMTDRRQPIMNQKIYVKDLSFETPNTPQVFQEKWEPEIAIQLRQRSSLVDDDTYEVLLEMTVTATIKDKTAYLVEVQMAGIFKIVGHTKAELGAALNVSCPQMLFPYVREMVSDVVIRGGFPQFLLTPISFRSLYDQQLAQAKSNKSDENKNTDQELSDSP